MFEQLDRRYLMRQSVEALGLYVVMICTGDLETSLDVGHDWVSISGEIIQVRCSGCGNAETEQLYPFSFWCCANETSHGSFCGHHGVVRAAVALNYY